MMTHDTTYETIIRDVLKDSLVNHVQVVKSNVTAHHFTITDDKLKS